MKKLIVVLTMLFAAPLFAEEVYTLTLNEVCDIFMLLTIEQTNSGLSELLRGPEDMSNATMSLILYYLREQPVYRQRREVMKDLIYDVSQKLKVIRQKYGIED